MTDNLNELKRMAADAFNRLKRIAADALNSSTRRGHWMDLDEQQEYIEQFIERYKDCDLDELERDVVAARPSPAEPDYTLTIIDDIDGFVVCEAGEQISRPFAERSEAEGWLRYYHGWNQPQCVVCRSGITRADDPWEVIQCSRKGAVYAHPSCWKKFEYWDGQQKHGPGPQPFPPMTEVEAAWSKRPTDP
jgi:hypothetical protein